MYCVLVAADTSQRHLVEQWKKSHNHVNLMNTIDPILDEAIDQPETLTPQYATSLLTQVRNYVW